MPRSSKRALSSACPLAARPVVRRPEVTLKPVRERVEKTKPPKKRGGPKKPRKEMSPAERAVNFHNRLLKAGIPSPYRVVPAGDEVEGEHHVREPEHSDPVSQQPPSFQSGEPVNESPTFRHGTLVASHYPINLLNQPLSKHQRGHEHTWAPEPNLHLGSVIDSQVQPHSAGNAKPAAVNWGYPLPEAANIEEYAWRDPAQGNVSHLPLL
jgi:hypothetical protein